MFCICLITSIGVCQALCIPSRVTVAYNQVRLAVPAASYCEPCISASYPESIACPRAAAAYHQRSSSSRFYFVCS